MIRVAIETSTRVGSVAVGRDDEVLARVELGEQTRHAARTVPALDEALAAAGIARSEIDQVVVGAGPGSFTGVRVAGATAKGLATALDVPLLAYSSLLALVVSAAADGVDRSDESDVRCGLFDARRGEVYGGCWRVASESLVEVVAPMVGGVGEVVDALAQAQAQARVVVVGDGVARYGEELEAACSLAGLHATLTAPEARPGAAALLWLAHRHPGAGRVADTAAWEPLYVRGSSAERGIPG